MRYFVVTAYNKASQTGLRSYKSRELLYSTVITNSTHCWSTPYYNGQRL